jgi:hypothetical protein
MSESRHVLDRRSRILGGIGSVIPAIAAQAPAPALAVAETGPPLTPAELSSCREARLMRSTIAPAVLPPEPPLEAVLDEEGVVVGHELRLGDTRLRLGPRALGFTAG